MVALVREHGPQLDGGDTFDESPADRDAWRECAVDERAVAATSFCGITISHFGEDGRTLDDRGHSDSMALPRQLGVIRTVVLGLEILIRRVKLPKGALRTSA